MRPAAFPIPPSASFAQQTFTSKLYVFRISDRDLQCLLGVHFASVEVRAWKAPDNAISTVGELHHHGEGSHIFSWASKEDTLPGVFAPPADSCSCHGRCIITEGDDSLLAAEAQGTGRREEKGAV